MEEYKYLTVKCSFRTFPLSLIKNFGGFYEFNTASLEELK